MKCNHINLFKIQKTVFILNLFYFLLGFEIAFSSFAIKLHFQSNDFSIADIQILLFLIYAPWTVKFVYGLISDTFPIYGQYRRPYIIITSTLSCILYFVIGGVIKDVDVNVFIVLYIILQVSVCWSDVMFDALMVNETKDEDHEDRGVVKINSDIVRAIGAGIGTFLGTSLYEYIFESGTFIILGSLHLIVVYISLRHLMPEIPAVVAVVAVASAADNEIIIKHKSGMCTNLGHSINTLFKTKTFRLILLFNIIMAAAPSSGTAMFWFIMDERHFTNMEMGTLSFIGELSRISGMLIYKYKFRHANVRTLYFYVMLISITFTIFPLILSTSTDRCLGVPAFFFALSDDVLGDVFAQFISTPLMIIIALISHNFAIATTYSMALSVINISGLLQGLTNKLSMYMFGIDHNSFDNLTSFIWFCFVIDLCLIPVMLKLIPDKNIDEITKKIDLDNENGTTSDDVVNYDGDDIIEVMF